MMKSTETLSKRQGAIVREVEALQRRRGVVTVAQLVRELGLANSSSLMPTLKRIAEKGYLQLHLQGTGQSAVVKPALRQRAAALPVGQSEGSGQAAGLGLGLAVFGSIAAGPPSEAVQEVEEEFVTLSDALRHKSGDILFRIRGNSMIGDGILDGDKVLITPCPHRSTFNGQILAVQVEKDDGSYEATLKHVYYRGGEDTMRLVASNPAVAEREVEAGRVRIVGLYDGRLIRS